MHRLLAVALTAICCAASSVAGQDAPPNLVVFLVDDMGVMDTSLPFLTDESGRPVRYPLNDYYRTPNMERLAERGVRFSNFYAMSVCSPTRISIMTGRTRLGTGRPTGSIPIETIVDRSGLRIGIGVGLSSGDVTLPRLLQAAGYRTIHVGKAHFGPRDSEGADPRNLGFDVNVGGRSVGAPGSYYAADNFGWGTQRESHAVPHLEQYHGTDTFLTEALTVEAAERVSQAAAEGRPFFLYLAHYAVHSPFQSDPRFAANYTESGKSDRAQAFATLIEGIDKSLGDLLDHLDEIGVADNTLVLFLGDNGSDAPLGGQHAVACAAPLRGKKGAHYEGGMRVPLIAAWAEPDVSNPHQQRLPIAAGAVQRQLGAVQDLFPTLLAAAGVASPGDHAVDGRPLDSLLDGETDPTRDETFLMHYPHAPHRSDYFTCYRNGDWKVVYHYRRDPTSGDVRYELFNLADDPFESTNLAYDRPEQLRAMMAGLRRAFSGTALAIRLTTKARRCGRSRRSRRAAAPAALFVLALGRRLLKQRARGEGRIKQRGRGEDRIDRRRSVGIRSAATRSTSGSRTRPIRRSGS